MSPLFIRMAIAYHVTPDPQQTFDGNQWYSPAGTACRDRLRAEGMIDDKDKPTPKLRFWVDHLCSIPLPVETYKIPGDAQ